MQAVLDFWITYFHTYDITTEVVMLLLIGIMFFITILSRPAVTHMMSIYTQGMICAALAIITHIWMLGETIVMSASGGMSHFNLAYILHTLFFSSELAILFVYHSKLSFRRKYQEKRNLLTSSCLLVICIVIMLIPMFKGSMLSYSDGRYTLSGHSNIYVLCSVICVFAIGIVTYMNRNDLSRPVYWGSTTIIPIELLGVLAQLYFPTAYFVSATYTLPLVIYYVLFHANKYDEITGCQGNDAERRQIYKNIKSKTKFLHVSVYMPKLENREWAEIAGNVAYVCNSLCRDIEKVSEKIHIYQAGKFEFNIICKVKSESERERLINEILLILDTSVEIEGKRVFTPLDIIISHNFDEIDSADVYVSLLRRKRKSAPTLADQSSVRRITEEEVASYKKTLEIEKNILDIRDKDDLDDERVLVYIQPIRDLKTDSYRTGEALMRLKLGDKIIYPGDFVAVAEEIDCIHALTRIMLYKVAKYSAGLASDSQFEAFTVNVSTMEMTNPNVWKEFMDIIEDAGADPKKIRIEITESTAIGDYSNVIENMKKMNDKGVYFYLDDFGTGFSNLERLITVPFKTIKFDKVLLYKALEDKKSEELFLLLIGFFRENGFSTVIEGVETEEQRDYVKKAGFDYIQGYYYSKPVPATEALDFYQ